MSRIAKAPVKVPKGVEVKIEGRAISVKGPLGAQKVSLHESVVAELIGDELKIIPCKANPDWAQAGTARAILNNAVEGVSSGFKKTLNLVGVGYRAQVKSRQLILSLGFSHPVEFKLPNGITAEMPSQTEIVLTGSDKHLLGQTAANIRSFRPPEPYKGKGVRLSTEVVKRKEAKKK